jgi:RimJ/RimL family protein N-acetyltransferase
MTCTDSDASPMTIRSFQEGDEIHVAKLGRVYNPHASESPEQIKKRLSSHAGSRYRRGMYFAFAGRRLLGSLAYAQHPHYYQPDLYCLHSRLDEGVPFDECGPELYRHVIAELQPLKPRILNAWARTYEQGFIRFLQDLGFQEFNRCLHMALDIPPGLCVNIDPPAGIEIVPFSTLNDRHEPLRNLYELEVETSRDVPIGQTVEPPDFDWWSKHMTDTAQWDNILVAMERTVFAGYTHLHQVGASHVHLAGTGVRRSHHNRGIASALKRASLRFASERGIKTIHTDNHVSNAAIIAANRKAGFEARWEELELESLFASAAAVR